MPITTLDPDVALLVIDLQQGLADLPTVHPADAVADRAGTLADAFRDAGRPVILVTADGVAPGRTDAGTPEQPAFPDGFTTVMPQLHQQAGDHTLTKQRWGAFHDTGLFELLQSLQITHVVIVGVASSVGVESTARAAYDHGLHVTIATDAITDVTHERHQHSVGTIFPTLGETGTTTDIIATLPNNASK